MKKLVLAVSTLAVSFSISAMAMADSHPCYKIAEACKSAGFVKHGAAGKDMKKDCMKPIMNGQSVSGVSADAADVQACQGKMQAHHKSM